MATTFKHYEQQTELLEAVENQGLMEELLSQNTEEVWSKEMSADELLEELGLGSNI
jgi:hypothetical protein